MCGIVGFTGKEQAAPILLDGLSKLEYRGYDSAGIAVRDGDRDVDIIKAKGRLKILAEKTNDGKAVIGSCGIGHTRWAKVIAGSTGNHGKCRAKEKRTLPDCQCCKISEICLFIGTVYAVFKNLRMQYKSSDISRYVGTYKTADRMYLASQ